MKPIVSNSNEEGPGIIALKEWATKVGVNSITTWRWRKKGWLTTTNIAGRQYLTNQALAEFTRRAEAGEFAKRHTVPAREAVAA